MSDSRTIGSPPLRLAFWSGPRNLSTAMMRSWENRADTQVMDEPLYAHYLTATGLTDHPMHLEILDSQPAEEAAAVETLFAPVPAHISVDFQKHMAQHLLPGMDRSWLDQQARVILLRDPRRVLASYTKVRGTVSLSDIGLPQQVELAHGAAVVIDSGHFLANPEAYLRVICEAVGVDFDPAMLRWPAGRRTTDGVWAPAWYSSVEASTGFGPPVTADPPVLPAGLASLVDESMDLYRGLLEQAVVMS